VHSEHALAPSLAREFYSAVTSEKAQLWLESAGQIDFYDDPGNACSAAVTGSVPLSPDNTPWQE
jgi:hypothetical protein